MPYWVYIGLVTTAFNAFAVWVLNRIRRDLYNASRPLRPTYSRVEAIARLHPSEAPPALEVLPNNVIAFREAAQLEEAPDYRHAPCPTCGQIIKPRSEP